MCYLQTLYSIIQKDDEHCDQWCYYEHLDDKCPAEYDAIDKANDAEFYDLKNLIKDIKAGKRKPGEGLLKVEVWHFI